MARKSYRTGQRDIPYHGTSFSVYKLEQSVPEGLHPVEGTHARAVHEELQPVRRTHVGEVWERLSPAGGTPG